MIDVLLILAFAAIATARLFELRRDIHEFDRWDDEPPAFNGPHGIEDWFIYRDHMGNLIGGWRDERGIVRDAQIVYEPDQPRPIDLA